MEVKILEAGSRLAGVRNSNTNPGARVDSPSPYYASDFEEICRTWNWTELYAGQKEIEAFFEQVDELLSIRKGCIFNTRVTAAHFDPTKAHWTVRSDNGQLTDVHAKYFIPAVGGFSKQYLPKWKGIESFHGPIYHSSAWPKGTVDVRGKRVAVLEQGARESRLSGEWAKEADETIVFQRTPTIALPVARAMASTSNRRPFPGEDAPWSDFGNGIGTGVDDVDVGFVELPIVILLHDYSLRTEGIHRVQGGQQVALRWILDAFASPRCPEIVHEPIGFRVGEEILV